MDSARTVQICRTAQPEDPRATVSVEMITANITEESTAVVEIGVTWEGDASVLLFGNTVPIELPHRCSWPETGLVLLPSPNGYERRADEPECWKPNLPADDDFGHPLGLMRKEVETGDILSCRAEIWGDHWAENCLEPGEYWFEETLSIENEGYAGWGFALRIES